MTASHPNSSSSDRPRSRKSVETRVEELEIIVSHLQNTVDDLNDAILLQQKRIDQFVKQLDLAKSAVEAVLHSDQPPRTLADDKPPHY
jgi:uncharacterized coiled-coil protein SlyX